MDEKEERSWVRIFFLVLLLLFLACCAPPVLMYVHKKEEEESDEHLENLQTLLTQNIFIQEEAKGCRREKETEGKNESRNIYSETVKKREMEWASSRGSEARKVYARERERGGEKEESKTCMAPGCCVALLVYIISHAMTNVCHFSRISSFYFHSLYSWYKHNCVDCRIHIYFVSATKHTSNTYLRKRDANYQEHFFCARKKIPFITSA